MAHLVIERRADRFWKSSVVERSWNGSLFDRNVFVADCIEFVSRYAWPDMVGDHVKHLGCHATCGAHLLYFLTGFYGYRMRSHLAALS